MKLQTCEEAGLEASGSSPNREETALRSSHCEMSACATSYHSAEVVPERHFNTQRELFRGNLIVLVKDDSPIAVEPQTIRKHFTKGFDEGRLAVEVHRVLCRPRSLPGDPDRATALGFRSEVRRFAPLERLFDLAYTFRRFCCLENEST